jgi:hypothetical protein
MSLVTCPSEQYKNAKKLAENPEKIRQFFSIPKPKTIPTENRHSSKKPIPIPTELKMYIPQGSSLKHTDNFLFTSNFQFTYNFQKLYLIFKITLNF